MMSQIALVSADRQIVLIDTDGSSHSITSASEIPLALWNQPKLPKLTHTWPTFSPDGKSIATFRMRGKDASVLVTDLSGSQGAEVIDLTGQMPIYLQWSHSGSWIAVVSQVEESLRLYAAPYDEIDAEQKIEEGSPLFFTWTLDHRLAVFSGGGSRRARMNLIDPISSRPTELLPGFPGDFCAPINTVDGVVYAASSPEEAELRIYANADTVRTLKGGTGLLAFLSSPDGKMIAKAVAPGGDGTPYRGLTILDVQSGEEEVLTQSELLAFMWTPDGTSILIARVDTDRGLVEWTRVEMNGTHHHIADLLPTRDLRFYLRFFEQYAQSHPIIDGASEWILLPGVLRGEQSSPRVWKVSLTGGKPVNLGEGFFATFGPPLQN